MGKKNEIKVKAASVKFNENVDNGKANMKILARTIKEFLEKYHGDTKNIKNTAIAYAMVLLLLAVS